MTTGMITYVPCSVMKELEAIQQRKKFRKKSDAFKEMAKYSQVGREAESILKLRF